MSTTTVTPDQPELTGPGATSERRITELRTRIDEIDASLVALWQERAALSRQVGEARVAAGGTRLALSREREILDKFHRELGPLGTQLGLLILRAGRGPL